MRGAGYPTWTGKIWRKRENFSGGIFFWRGKGMVPMVPPSDPLVDKTKGPVGC